MKTYVFIDSGNGRWHPRTSYGMKIEQAKAQVEKVLTEQGLEAAPQRVLLIEDAVDAGPLRGHYPTVCEYVVNPIGVRLEMAHATG